MSVIGEASASRPWLLRGTLAGDSGELALVLEADSKTLRVERVIGRQREERLCKKPWKPIKGPKGKAGGKGK